MSRSVHTFPQKYFYFYTIIRRKLVCKKVE